MIFSINRGRVGIVVCVASLSAIASSSVFSQDVDSLPGMRTLLTQLQQTEQSLSQLNGRVSPMEARARDLMTQVAAIEERKERPEDKPPEEKKAAKKVEFRLPRMQEKQRDTPAIIVCENNRVTIFDLDAAVKIVLDRFSGSPISGTATPPPGHFDGVYSVGFAGLGMTLSRKSGHTGETEQDVANANSEFQRFVGRLNSNSDVIQFAVYPDSYDAFRRAREVVWKKGFDVRWIPMVSGDPVQIGSGGSTRVD